MVPRIITFCSIVLIIFLVFIFVGIINKCAEKTYSTEEIQVQLTPLQKAELNRLFTKHGVWYAWVDGGDVWFWRDGRRCRFK